MIYGSRRTATSLAFDEDVITNYETTNILGTTIHDLHLGMLLLILHG